jgi:hypothetical protein
MIMYTWLLWSSIIVSRAHVDGSQRARSGESIIDAKVKSAQRITFSSSAGDPVVHLATVSFV